MSHGGARPVPFSEHQGRLFASCFDSQDPVEWDGVVKTVAQKAGIRMRWRGGGSPPREPRAPVTSGPDASYLS